MGGIKTFFVYIGGSLATLAAGLLLMEYGQIVFLKGLGTGIAIIGAMLFVFVSFAYIVAGGGSAVVNIVRGRGDWQSVVTLLFAVLLCVVLLAMCS
ncbi:hypothetical protein [Hyphomonas sp.]|uniref:hypothetical protein n=1 Tax=Hyphomonas sp. TaxID=87 RepID=UPI00391D573A